MSINSWRRKNVFNKSSRVAVITAMGLADPGALDPESFGNHQERPNCHQDNQAPRHLRIGMLLWRGSASL